MLRQCHVSDCSIKKNYATYATGRAHGVDGIAARVGEIVAAHALGVLHGRLITFAAVKYAGRRGKSSAMRSSASHKVGAVAVGASGSFVCPVALEARSRLGYYRE